MTDICVGKLITIGSDNGLSPGWRQAIIRINAGILAIWSMGTNFSEMLSKLKHFHSRKCIWKCRLFVSALMCWNVYLWTFYIFNRHCYVIVMDVRYTEYLNAMYSQQNEAMLQLTACCPNNRWLIISAKWNKFVLLFPRDRVMKSNSSLRGRPLPIDTKYRPEVMVANVLQSVTMSFTFQQFLLFKNFSKYCRIISSALTKFNT